MTGELLLLDGLEPLPTGESAGAAEDDVPTGEFAVADAPMEEYVEDDPAFKTGATTLVEDATPLCCERTVAVDVPFEVLLLLKGPANDVLVEAPNGLSTGLEPPTVLAATVTVTSFLYMTVVVACRQVRTDAPVNGDSPLPLLAPVNGNSPLPLPGACDSPAAIEVRG